MKDSTGNEVLKMIKIISDSTCDLSQEVLERYDIDIIPLHIVKGAEVFGVVLFLSAHSYNA